MKVWKWGVGGFGYSSTGVNGPYTTGIAADGTIVAMLVAANIITADMVQTGTLRSEDGETWVNLNDGTFNLKDKIKFINGEFRIDLADSEEFASFVGDISTLELTASTLSTRIGNAEGDISTLDKQ